jgi:hypothetical protein
MARREYKGAAVQTRLSANIGSGDTTFGIVNAAGWPTGGANGDFIVTLDPGQSTEERILVDSRSATTLSGVVRGYDDTTAVAHNAGADGTVIHSSSAIDHNEANAHINDTTLDHHTQYMRTDGTRHDLTARHPGGTVVPTAVPVAIGTALAEGAGTNLAKSTHVHVIDTGAINNANMFAAGVVDANAIGADQVGTSEIAPLAVTSAELAADSVISSKIADTAIDNENYFSTGLSPIIVQATNPGAVGAGRVWLNTAANKNALLERNAADTGWKVIAGSDWISYTPSVFNITHGNGVRFGRYIRIGQVIVGNIFYYVGTTTVFGANIGFGLPHTAKDLDSFVGYPGVATNEFFTHGASRATLISSGVFAAVGVIAQAGPSKALDRVNFFATAGSAAWGAGVPGAWGSGDRLSIFYEYEVANAEDTNYV